MVTSSIKASGGNYTTIAAWEADGRLPADIGELYGETYSEGTASITTAGLVLRANSGALGDGTYGGGAPLRKPSGSGHAFEVSVAFTIEGIEVHTGTSDSDECFRMNSGANITARKCLFSQNASQTGTEGDCFYMDAASVEVHAENCCFKGFTRASGGSYKNNFADTVVVDDTHCTHYNPGGGCIDHEGRGTWTLNGSLYRSSAATVTGSDNAQTIDVQDCIFSDDPEASITFDTDTNNTISTTFTDSTASSAVILTNLTTDFHLVDHANNLAIGHVDAARTPYLSDDVDGDTRPAGANAAGFDEIPVATLPVAALLKTRPNTLQRM